MKKTGKILALFVALAMLVSVVPAFTAAAEEVETVDINGHRYRVISEVKMPADAGFEGDRSSWTSYFTWDKSSITPLSEEVQISTENVHSGSQALYVPGNGGTGSINGSFVGMFYFNEDESPVAEEKIYAFTFWRYAPNGRMSISVGASADPYSQTVDYDADFASQYGSWGNSGGQGSDVTNLTSGRWAREGVLIKTTAGVSTMVKVFARYCGGNYFDDFAIYEIDPEPIQPDATATVRLIKEDAEPEILGKVENLYAGDTMELPSAYDYEGIVEPDFEEGMVYTYTNPEPIVLQEGDENYLDITYGPYKQIVSENLFADGGFDSGSLEGWFTGEGTPLADAPGTAYLEDGALHTVASGSGYGAAGSFETRWPIPEPGASYLIGADVMATTGTKEGYGHQYAWFLTWGNPDNETGEDGLPVSEQTSVIADYMDGSTAGQLGSDGSNGLHPLVADEYVTRAFAYTTAETDTDFGFRTAWLRDCTAVYDNFFLYELDDIAADPNAVRYNIVYTLDGTAEGEVVGRSPAQRGTAGDVVEVPEGTLEAARLGNVFYTNEAAQITLEAGVEEYYVPVKALAVITGAVADTVKTVGDYAPFLPATAKLVTDNEEFNKIYDQTVNVTDWVVDGGKAVGTVEGYEGITATAAIETLDTTFTLIDNESQASQNNYEKGQQAYVRFPNYMETSFVIEMTVTLNSAGNQFLFINDSSNDGFFGPDQVAIGLNGNFTPVNGNGSGGRVSEDTGIMAMETGKPYYVLIKVDPENNSYTASVSDGINSATAENMGFRTNSGMVDGLVAIGNTNANSPDGAVQVTNIQVHAPEVDVPDAAGISAGLGYVTADETEKLTINFTVDGAYAGQYLTIIAQDSVVEGNALTTPTVVYDEPLTDGDNLIALIPGSPNMTYTAIVSDANSGYALAKTSAALYPMVAADIAANLKDYTAAKSLARIDQAIEAISAGGAVYDAEGNFGDGRDAFIDVEIGEDSTVITLDRGLYDKGIGFRASTKVGVKGDLKDAVKDELFYKITITGDDVTLESADMSVTLSLDSVEIEFVETEITQPAADGADADFGFIPEL